MLVEDTSAFIEQLEVPEDDRRAEKHRRRLAQARVEVLAVELEVRVAAEALREMERVLALESNSGFGSAGRGLLRDRRIRSLQRQIAVIRKRLQAKRAELEPKRQRLHGLERRVDEIDIARRAVKLFRLHSSQHHLECSERRFARLARSQGELPVLVGRQDGRRWWWYLDRFWWDDEGLAADDVETIVLQADLGQRQRAAALARARAAVLGDHPVTTAPSPPASQVVRFAVWCRSKGRCVDCGTREHVVFDRIIPLDEGGSDTAANVELRCEPCTQRRVANEARARVSRAQVDAGTYYR